MKTPTWNQNKAAKGSGRARIIILQALFIVVSALLIKYLWNLQVVEGEKYAESFELQITRIIVEKGTRGNIYDCNGSLLAGNKLVSTVTMTDDGSYGSNREKQLALNSVIYRLRKKLAQNGEQLQNELKICVGSDGEYEYTTDGNALRRFKADIFGKTDPGEMTEEQAAVSAPEMIEYLSSGEQFALYGTREKKYTAEELRQYGLPDEYSKEEILDLVGIRYMLSLHSYRKYQAVTIARDISSETVAYVLENKPDLTGIEIGREWERVYEGGEAFAHILGYVGGISPQELETLKAENPEYSMDSVVGKSGIEQYYETELQGKDGEKAVMVDNRGRIMGDGETLREPEAGKDVYLSIDKDLQTAVYQILEQTLAGIISANLIDTRYFDKTGIRDASEIRIPVFDVYLALVENEIISIESMKQESACGLEKEIAEKILYKKEEMRDQLLSELTDTPHVYGELSEEMKEYVAFIIQDSGLTGKEKTGETDEFSAVWEKREKNSLKELLEECVGKGWIDPGILGQMADSEAGFRPKQDVKYITAEEAYALVVQYILEIFGESPAVEKILFQYMILEEEISQWDFCRLLYEQDILVKDGYYDGLTGHGGSGGGIDPFAFIREKIENLEITPSQLALDPCSASAVVVQEDTGKILACVTYPGYDNNRLANKMDSKYYEQLLRDRLLPLYNRATQQLTAPGSTLKPVTVIAGLEEGVILPDTAVICDGVFDKVSPSLKCWKHVGHGTVSNAASAIQNSCNDYLCEISYRLGQLGMGSYDDRQALSTLQKYASLLDLDKKSGIEIAESSPNVTQEYGIPSAIGQGTHNYTTVQLARYMNTLASRGNSFCLSLTKGIADRSGTIIEPEPILQNRVYLEETTWETVWQGMILFAQNNSVLKDMEISIAGKTGTAQESKARPDHALFIGCAPAGDPQISLAVRIANGYGSSNATRAGKDIFNYYFGLESREMILNGKASEVSNSRSD